MNSSRSKRTRRSKSYTLGTDAFASISAVEGLHLSSTSRKRLDQLKTAGLSHEEIRAAILRAYKSSSGRE
jgi:hypothetical protein